MAFKRYPIKNILMLKCCQDETILLARSKSYQYSKASNSLRYNFANPQFTKVYIILKISGFAVLKAKR